MLFICSEREDKICKYLTNAQKYCQMFDELIYSDVQKCLLKWDSMYFYVCYSELNLLGKVLLKIFNVILCRLSTGVEHGDVE